MDNQGQSPDPPATQLELAQAPASEVKPAGCEDYTQPEVKVAPEPQSLAVAVTTGQVEPEVESETSDQVDSDTVDFVTSQPWLFNPPAPPLFFEQVKTYLEKKPRHTGKILRRRRPELCELVAELLLAGVPARRIEHVFKINRNSLRPIIQWMEETGKLAPLAKRLADDFLDTAAMANEEMQKRLLAGAVPAQFLPAYAGVSFDKAQLAMGRATVIVAQKTGVTMDDVNRLIDELPRADAVPAEPAAAPGTEPTDGLKGVSPDSQSGDIVTEQAQTGQSGGMDTALDTGPGPRQRAGGLDGAPVAGSPPCPPPGRADAPPREDAGGRGGVARAGGSPDAIGSTV